MKLLFALGFLQVLFVVVSAANEYTDDDQDVFEKCIEYALSELLWGNLVPTHQGYDEILVSGYDYAQKSILRSEEDGPKLYQIKDMETNVTFTCPDCSVDPCCQDKVWSFLNCSAGCLVAEGANDYGVQFAYGFEVACTGFPPRDCSAYTCPSREQESYLD